jgi:riboflavin synthase
MFTGIVEQTVRVVEVAAGPKSRRLTLSLDFPDLRHGQSIAVNGVCLTIAELGAGKVSFDIIEETLTRTNLGLLKASDEVHVERSLRIGDRLDGHFVQGHVDGLAKNGLPSHHRDHHGRPGRHRGRGDRQGAAPTLGKES